MQTSIKQAITEALTTTDNLSEEDISTIVQEVTSAFTSEHGIQLTSETVLALTDLAREFAQTETATDADAQEQLDASTSDRWTMVKAIDLWEATMFSDINDGSIIRENYDRSYCTEVSSNEEEIVLHLRNAGSGGSYVTFSHSGPFTVITHYSGNASYPDNLSYSYWVGSSNFRIFQEYDYHTMLLTNFNDDGTVINTHEEDPAAVTEPEHNTEQASEANDTTSDLSWDADNAAELANFMATWGTSMSQNYTSYLTGGAGTMFGPSFPDEIMGTLAVNGEAVDAFWSYDGLSTDGDYAIVAAYADYEDIEQYERNPNYYLFAIVGDQAIVLHSQQNQGMPDGLTHFSATQNAELQAGFDAIVRN